MAGKDDRGVSRRAVLSAGGMALTAFGTAGLLPKSAAAASTNTAPAATQKDRYVTAVEGTNIAVTVAPDGKTLAFDLYGVLWLVGIDGGVARSLTDDVADIAQPDWSPDGRSLVFQSYRDGNFHLWRIGVDGSGIEQLTRGPYDSREPRFSPDGSSIAFSSDRAGAYAIHLLDLTSGNVKKLTGSGEQESQPAWSPDGSRIAFVADGAKLQVLEVSSGKTSTAVSIGGSSDILRRRELLAPNWTPDGQSLVYVQVEGPASRLATAARSLVEGEDVFPFRVAWLGAKEFIYAANGKIRRRHVDTGVTRVIEFSATVPVVTPKYAKRRRDFDSTAPRPVKGIGSPVLSPDGTRIAFRALNDIWTMPVGGKPVALTNDGFYKCDPAWSPDGKQLAYSSDRGGKLEIWLRDLGAGVDRQLTRTANAAVSGSWSADGSLVAFLDQNGALHTVEVASGKVQKVFDALWEPGRPTWSPDGRFIAMAAFKPYSARYREGLSELLVVERASGAATYSQAFPNKSLSTRGDDGPVWSPDGKRMAFVVGSVLWVVAVDAAGRFTGAPRQVTTETTDAPSWSGDSKTLLYLSNGRLRLVNANGGAARDVPLRLTWNNVLPKGRVIVRAGKLWDGQGPTYRRNVDVVIEGNRIVALQPSGSTLPSDRNARFIDASESTLMPGLVDMHTHRQMQGYGYGDRQGRLWLAMGVTTTRSPGAPAYHMVEDREAIDAGARIGPRHFATGEAIDGSRIFYNFMRPVTEPGQMELELARAEALEYDLIKTYVRLAPERQREVVTWAHARGMHVTSHYHFPSLRFGVDCMEHLGATNRFGYSRTATAAGAAYQDVTALFVQSQAGRTPTLFSSTGLLGEDRSLVEDERIRTLYPAWEYARLVARAKQMEGGGGVGQLRTLERNVEQAKVILRNGGRILTGTDAPIDFLAVSLHLNLRGMVKFGVSPYEALLTATRFPGEFLEEPLGVIAPDALADMVIVKGDPLARIEDAANVSVVIKNGAVFSIDDLVQPFRDLPSVGPSTSAQFELLQAPLHASNAGYWWHDPEYVHASRASCCANHSAQG